MNDDEADNADADGGQLRHRHGHGLTHDVVMSDEWKMEGGRDDSTRLLSRGKRYLTSFEIERYLTN